MEMPKVVATTRTKDGEYSTILRDGNVLETCFFGDDGSSEVIGVSYLAVWAIHNKHMVEYERRMNDVHE